VAQKQQQPEKEQENFQQILKQNISINKFQGRDGFGKGGMKGGVGWQDKKDRVLSDNEVKTIMEKIETYNKDQELLEEYQIEKESLGWDLKFQNYWGYIIAADRNFEQTLSMCEKLFKHVGEFREHAAAQVKRIVDHMHDPNNNQTNVDKSLIPIAPESITEEHKVFMDEEDNSLYFSGPGYHFNLDK
jgi:DNA-directed RNA polymerase subunit F